jgi:hypothetical protein
MEDHRAMERTVSQRSAMAAQSDGYGSIEFGFFARQRCADGAARWVGVNVAPVLVRGI